MELTIKYILSQFFTITMYLILVLSYQSKKRSHILVLSLLSQVTCGIAYILLEAYTGLAMCIIALIRDVIFMIDENKNGKRDFITKKDVIFLIILYLLMIISTVFTYQGLYSLLSVIATMIFTYSIWQKNTKVYKLLGIPVGTFWILYNLYVKSIFGVILESALLIASIVGFIRDGELWLKKSQRGQTN